MSTEKRLVSTEKCPVVVVIHCFLLWHWFSEAFCLSRVWIGNRSCIRHDCITMVACWISR